MLQPKNTNPEKPRRCTFALSQPVGKRSGLMFAKRHVRSWFDVLTGSGHAVHPVAAP